MLKKICIFFMWLCIFFVMILAVLVVDHIWQTSKSNTPSRKECISLGFRGDMSWWSHNNRVIINSPDNKYHGLVGELKEWKENAKLWLVYLYDRNGNIQCVNFKPSQICNISCGEKMPVVKK